MNRAIAFISSKRFWPALVIILAFMLTGAVGSVRAQDSNDEDEPAATGVDSAAVAHQLSSSDPLERQRAAEELARLAAVDQLKVVSGYRLQEKNARVRLALDWALYRMGKTETLFNIVRDLDSSRSNQSSAYLTQLDTPAPLYIFLDRASIKTRIGLIEALARIGDADTIERLKPFTTDGYDPKTADAAEFAIREINTRLAQSPLDTPARQRQVGNDAEKP